MTKTEHAFRFTVDAMNQDQLRLWTFTFPEVISVEEATKRWSALAKDLVRKINFCGVRVFELHTSHGLHVHVLVDKFFMVRQVRYYAEKHGFGRIHVVRIQSEGRHYIGKYLSKGFRAPCLKGRRLWQAFGNIAHSLVRNIVTESTYTRMYHAVRPAAAAMSPGEQHFWSARVASFLSWLSIGTFEALALASWRGDVPTEVLLPKCLGSEW